MEIGNLQLDFASFPVVFRRIERRTAANLVHATGQENGQSDKCHIRNDTARFSSGRRIVRSKLVLRVLEIFGPERLNLLPTDRERHWDVRPRLEPAPVLLPEPAPTPYDRLCHPRSQRAQD
jgi:hypothetical protein